MNMNTNVFGKPLCRAMMAVAMVLLSLQAMALDYDFSYTYQGKTLYYEILTGSTNAVAVTNYSTAYSINNHVSGGVVIPSSVEYNGATYSVTSIGRDAFMNCPDLISISIPNTVTSIGGFAFRDCTGLISITIPNSVTSIGRSAFSGCTGLTSITIPNSVTSIEPCVCFGCSSLNSINVASGSTHYSSIEGVLYDYDQSTLIQCPATKPSISIPNSVTAISEGAFSYCSRLTSVTISNNVIYIGEDAFFKCSSLNSINVASENTHYSSIDGVLYDYAKDTLIQCPATKTSVSIPNSVTIIGDLAFADCISLTSVTIPNNVTTIGYSAFEDCSSLTSVTIGNSVTTIYDWAFSGCSSLTSIKCWACNPPSIDYCSFDDTPDTLSLTVPCGCLGSYMWGDWVELLYEERISEGLSLELSVSANDEAYGRVEVEDHSCELKTLTAIANDGYVFNRWSDGNTENPRTVTITGDTAFVAIFNAEGSVSLQEVNTREFALYPNPAKSFVNLEFEALKENTLLQILDLNGRKIKTFDLKAGQEALRIDVGKLSKGVYTIMLGNTAKKLIVE